MAIASSNNPAKRCAKCDVHNLGRFILTAGPIVMQIMPAYFDSISSSIFRILGTFNFLAIDKDENVPSPYQVCIP